MKKLSKIALLRTFTILVLVALPILGTDCEDIINQLGNNPCSGTNTIAGDWTNIYNAGTTNDICPGERVVYPNGTSGTATLTCPQNSAVVNRLYTLSGTTLTYTETGAEYSVQFTSDCQLVLTGINNNRILYYAVTSSISDKSKTNNDTNTEKINSVNSNSSEINK